MNRERLVRWIAGAAPPTVVGFLSALAVMLWESNSVSPADGDPEARRYFWMAATLWALMLAVSARLGLRRARQPAETARRWTPGSLITPLAAGAMVGTALFAAVVMPSGRSEARWQSYRAAMRSDLRRLVEAQEAYVRQHGRPASEWGQLELFASEGIVIDLRSDSLGWSADARHLGMDGWGYPEAVCVVFDGNVGVNAIHRLPDGRIPVQAAAPECAWGRYFPPSNRNQ